MGLSITVLGCSGTYAEAGNACTGYLVESGQCRVWLDAGPGTLANLQHHLGPDELDAIVLTHEHPDHWLEMPVVFNALTYFCPPDSPIPVYLTAGTADRFEVLSPDCRAPRSPLDLRVIDERSRIAIGDQQWRFSRTYHYVETMAVHVSSAGRTLAFSADTGPEWGLVAFDQPIDLALVESSLPDRDRYPDVQHLTPTEAGQMAAAASVGRLVLTHLPPGADRARHHAAAQAAYGRPVEMAQVGATFTV